MQAAEALLVIFDGLRLLVSHTARDSSAIVQIAGQVL
jgi:hypothetical protein